jgi:5-methylcytosine-specific restriction endonuclease McrA
VDWFKHMTRKITVGKRTQVAIRDNGVCKICGKKADYSKFHSGYLSHYEIKFLFGDRYDIPFDIDHVKPFSYGGNSQIDNLRLACQFCNRSRGNG